MTAPFPHTRVTLSMDAKCVSDTLSALFYATGLLHASSFIHSFETAPKDDGVMLRVVFACRYAEERPALVRFVAEFVDFLKHDDDLHAPMFTSLVYNGERANIAQRVRAALTTPAA